MYRNQSAFVGSVHAMADPLKATAMLRARMHAGNGQNFERAYDRHYVGLKGEQAFAESFREPIVYWDQPSGDNGEDFWVPLFFGEDGFGSFSVDVKTSRRASAIVVPKGKVRADIYVLAHYDDATDTANLIGWQWAKIVRESPVRRFSEECHFCTAIRPLKDLAVNSVSLWTEDGPPVVPAEWGAVRLVVSN